MKEGGSARAIRYRGYLDPPYFGIVVLAQKNDVNAQLEGLIAERKRLQAWEAEHERRKQVWRQ